MAAPNIERVFHLSGSLILNPSTFAAGPPAYGGTQLGTIRDGRFAMTYASKKIRGEEFGNAVVDSVYNRPEGAITALFGEWDIDLINTLFPGSILATGGSTDHRVIEQRVSGAGVNRPGSLLSDKSVKLLFAPADTGRVPGFIFYNAMPAIQETMQLRLVLQEPFGLAVAFWALPNANHRLYQMERLQFLDFAG